MEVTLTPRDVGEIANTVVVVVDGDWNDGDWITEVTEFTLDNFKNSGYKAVDALREFGDDYSNAPEIARELICDIAPAGQPDGAEFHTMQLSDVYAYDANGHKCDIDW